MASRIARGHLGVRAGWVGMEKGLGFRKALSPGVWLMPQAENVGHPPSGDLEGRQIGSEQPL